MLDIHKMFNVVLLVMFIGACVTIASALFMCCSLKIIANCLSLGSLASFAGFIMLHIYRFNPAGKFCSGDYADNRGDAPLWSKGSFLLGYMIFAWSSLGLACVCCCFAGVFLVAFRK